MKRILVTGGCGFIGHHFVEHVLKHTDWHVVVLDRLNYASNGFDRLRDISVFDDKRVRVFTGDLTHELGEGLRREIGEVDYLVHMAAETHVDHSIADPWPFIQSNIVGTYRVLELARRLAGLKKMIYFSTDEVFGPAGSKDYPIWSNNNHILVKYQDYREWDRYNSSNPYAATKAAGEELCLAWANTYKVPVLVTHTMNVVGERQHPEKFVPSTVRKILDGEKVTIHADPTKTVSGSRMYIHARNVADAVLFLLEKDVPVREKYNIVGEKEITNLEMAKTIAHVLGRDLKYELVDFHSSRPGHDLRYALSGSKMDQMGWRAPVGFEESLERTIRWIADPAHARWLCEMPIYSGGAPETCSCGHSGMDHWGSRPHACRRCDCPACSLWV